MTCLHLPDIELGRSYPTIGPQGTHDSDINGKACGIELYLGKTALSSASGLRPVRWTGKDQKMGVWQGEIDNKIAVRESFLEELTRSSHDPHAVFPEMSLVWKTILDGAREVAEASQISARVPRRW